jgi:hypothetical protein
MVPIVVAPTRVAKLFWRKKQIIIQFHHFSRKNANQCLYFSLSIHLPIYLSIYLSIFIYIYLFIYLSIIHSFTDTERGRAQSRTCVRAANRANHGSHRLARYILSPPSIENSERNQYVFSFFLNGKNRIFGSECLQTNLLFFHETNEEKSEFLNPRVFPHRHELCVFHPRRPLQRPVRATRSLPATNPKSCADSTTI